MEDDRCFSDTQTQSVRPKMWKILQFNEIHYVVFQSHVAGGPHDWIKLNPQFQFEFIFHLHKETCWQNMENANLSRMMAYFNYHAMSLNHRFFPSKQVEVVDAKAHNRKLSNWSSNHCVNIFIKISPLDLINYKTEFSINKSGYLCAWYVHRYLS